MSDEIRLVRLSTTEEVIGKVTYTGNDTGDVKITDPVIFVQNPQNPSQLIPSPWVPVAKKREITVHGGHILFMTEIEANLENHYKRLIAGSKGITLVDNVPESVAKEIKSGSKIILP